MSSLPLWLALEPELSCTKLLLSHSSDGTLLKARLSATPAHPGALAMLLESLSAWQGMPLYAVLDADAEGVSKHPECWARRWPGASACTTPPSAVPSRGARPPAR